MTKQNHHRLLRFVSTVSTFTSVSATCFGLGCTILLGGCSSAGKIKELREAPQCQVWKEGTFGVKTAQVDSSEHAVAEGSCAFPCLLGAPKTFARFGGTERNELHLDSNAVISASDKVGGLQDNTLLLAHPSSIINFDAAEIGKDKVTIKQHAAGFTSTTEYFFNSKCNTRQKALGVTALVYMKE